MYSIVVVFDKKKIKRVLFFFVSHSITLGVYGILARFISTYVYHHYSCKYNTLYHDEVRSIKLFDE